MKFFKPAFVLFMALSAALLFSVLRAAALDGTVNVSRLTKTHVQIDIFVTGGFDPGAKYGGTLGGKYFQCEAVSADQLVCTGPFRAGSDPALLSVFEKSTKEIIFQKTIFPPRNFNEGAEEETPAAPVCDPDIDPWGCDRPM